RQRTIRRHGYAFPSAGNCRPFGLRSSCSETVVLDGTHEWPAERSLGLGVYCRVSSDSEGLYATRTMVECINVAPGRCTLYDTGVSKRNVFHRMRFPGIYVLSPVSDP